MRVFGAVVVAIADLAFHPASRSFPGAHVGLHEVDLAVPSVCIMSL